MLSSHELDLELSRKTSLRVSLPQPLPRSVAGGFGVGQATTSRPRASPGPLGARPRVRLERVHGATLAGTTRSGRDPCAACGKVFAGPALGGGRFRVRPTSSPCFSRPPMERRAMVHTRLSGSWWEVWGSSRVAHLLRSQRDAPRDSLGPAIRACCFEVSLQDAAAHWTPSRGNLSAAPDAAPTWILEAAARAPPRSRPRPRTSPVSAPRPLGAAAPMSTLLAGCHGARASAPGRSTTPFAPGLADAGVEAPSQPDCPR